MNTRCKGITRSGERCRSTAVGEDGYCHHHSPSRKAGTKLTSTASAETPAATEEENVSRVEQAEKILKQGQPLPEKMMPAGVGSWSVITSIIRETAKDEESQRLLLAEAAGYRHAFAEEYGVETVLERMIADRIVLSYQRLLLLEAYTDIEHELGENTHEHLDLHRKMVVRESAEFLRNVRALKDLKTVPLTVTIKDAGQVNVGQQQVNVTDRQQVDKARQAGKEVLDVGRSETQASDSTQAHEDVE